jgi:hypothetical protein
VEGEKIVNGVVANDIVFCVEVSAVDLACVVVTTEAPVCAVDEKKVAACVVGDAFVVIEIVVAGVDGAEVIEGASVVAAGVAGSEVIVGANVVAAGVAGAEVVAGGVTCAEHKLQLKGQFCNTEG